MVVTSKGQITIPIDIRRKLGLMPNTRVVFQVEGDSLRLRKATGSQIGRGRQIVEHLKGRATSKLSTHEIMAITRDESSS